jgi:hypothetical protein
MRRAATHESPWEPERIILAHGRWYDHDAIIELHRAFRWLFDKH